MAFKMNRPIIKGTSHHKASIAKAKAQSVVSQSRTKADAGLIKASNDLGKSYKPSEVDFELDEIKVDVAEKKALTPEEQAEKDANRAKRKAKRKEIGRNILDKGGKIAEGVGVVVGGAMLVPVAIGNGLFKVGEYVVNGIGEVVKKVSGKIKDKKDKNDAEYEAEQNEIAANYVGEGEIDDPENDYTKTQAYKDDQKKKQEAENEAKFRADQAANKPITLAPQSVRSLPSKAQKDKLMESIGTQALESSKSGDRQLDKLDKHIEEKGLDIDPNTEKGKKEYIELYEQMTYDDKTDEWKVPHIEVETPETQKNKQDAANMYRVSRGSMELQEDGSYVPMEGTQSEYGEVWQNGEWVDTPESETYYSPEGKKISKEKFEKLAIKQEEKGVKALRQQNIDEAREYYGDVVTTKERFAEYMRLKNEGTLAESYQVQLDQAALDAQKKEDEMLEIEEEDDIDFAHPDYVEPTTNEPVVEKITTEPVVEQKSTTTPTEKPKLSDFKNTKNAFGGFLSAKEQYKKALKEYESKSAMTMRDNRIYRNAVEGGTVRRNMIKSGYTPE